MDAAAQLRGLAPRIAALAHGDRDTLLLYAWGGLGYGKVADARGIPVGTVRSRLHRVRRKLANDPTSTTRVEDVTGSQLGRDASRVVATLAQPSDVLLEVRAGRVHLRGGSVVIR